MKITITAHSFAPELNKVNFIGKNGEVKGSLVLAGCTSIKEARRRLFSRNKSGRYVKVSSTYSDVKHQWLNTSKGGYVSCYKDIVEYLNMLSKKNPGSVLLDGSVLPPVNVNVESIKYICA